MDAIVRFYVKQIKLGKMFTEDVPKRWRDAVIAALGTV